ncbi:MAG: hypothetical protein OEZ23_05675, partial [Gammaproteobacteria bacterium]|nr:hypothetical protein [Gammaproteobacteria bacterium]
TEIQEARNRVLTPPAETPQRPPETVADDTSAGGLGEAQPDSQLAKGSNVVAPEQQGSADSQDDDIVARQLREAAVAETDPELKAKLWEEYHRYKAGAGN